MIPLISRLISLGYTATQVLNYAARKFTGAQSSINSARTNGYSDDDILKYFSRAADAKIGKQKPLSSENRSLKAGGYLTKEEREENKDKYLGAAIKLGSTALAAYGAYAGLKPQGAVRPSAIYPAQSQKQLTGPPGQLPAPQQQLTLPFNQKPQMPPPGPLITPPPTQPAGPSPMATAPGAGAQQQQSPTIPIAQTPAPIAQQSPAQPQSQFVSRILKGKQIQDLPAEYQKEANWLTSSLAKLEQTGQEWESKQVQQLATRLNKLVSGKPSLLQEEQARVEKQYPEKLIPPIGQEVQKEEEIPQQEIFKEEKEKVDPIQATPMTKESKPQKEETVITKKGKLAKIKSISGYQALIEEDGKLTRVNIEDLRAEPEAIKKSKVIFDPSKIPESERSAALSFVIPMPGKKMITILHHGEPVPYVYARKDGKEVDEKVLRGLIDGTELPVTTDETFMGGWNSSVGDSRGSMNFKELVAKSQPADEPDDPSKPYIFYKLEDVFVHGYVKDFYKILKEFTRAHGAKKK